MLSVFLAHARADAPAAEELRSYLEKGCDDITIAADDGLSSERDLLHVAELGRSADVLVLLLSSASNPPRWPRARWEGLLPQPTADDGTRVAIFLLEECVFPAVLRRGLKLFDATGDRLPALRQFKRWLWGIRHATFPGTAYSADLENLYREVADQPGILTAPGAMAQRFAQQAAQEFEAVFWVPAHGRTVAQIAGNLGAQLGMTLEGTVEENCRRIRELLRDTRCLLVLDAPQNVPDPLLPLGRTSVVFTSEPVRIVSGERSFSAARALTVGGRFAEAYEVFYELLNEGSAVEACARELVWICEHWGRVDEANSLRFHLGPSPTEQMWLFG